MWSSLGDCPSEGRAEEGPCLESGSMPGRWHARGRTELAFLQGVVTCSIQFDTRCPLARPSGGSPPTLAGALPPEFIYGACPSSLSLAVSQLSACMCLSRESCFVLYCLHSCSPYVCVCINMKRLGTCLAATAAAVLVWRERHGRGEAALCSRTCRTLQTRGNVG
jgi:hypothetical protein